MTPGPGSIALQVLLLAAGDFPHGGPGREQLRLFQCGSQTLPTPRHLQGQWEGVGLA